MGKKIRENNRAFSLSHTLSLSLVFITRVIKAKKIRKGPTTGPRRKFGGVVVEVIFRERDANSFYVRSLFSYFMSRGRMSVRVHTHVHTRHTHTHTQTHTHARTRAHTHADARLPKRHTTAPDACRLPTGSVVPCHFFPTGTVAGKLDETVTDDRRRVRVSRIRHWRGKTNAILVRFGPDRCSQVQLSLLPLFARWSVETSR